MTNALDGQCLDLSFFKIQYVSTTTTVSQYFEGDFSKCQIDSRIVWWITWFPYAFRHTSWPVVFRRHRIESFESPRVQCSADHSSFLWPLSKKDFTFIHHCSRSISTILLHKLLTLEPKRPKTWASQWKKALKQHKSLNKSMKERKEESEGLFFRKILLLSFWNLCVPCLKQHQFWLKITILTRKLFQVGKIL